MWQGNRFQGFGLMPGGMGLVTRRLLAITVGVFILDFLLWPGRAGVISPFERVFGLSRSGLASGMLWQPLTYQFLHGSFMHLFGNMLGLYFFGSELESRLGGRRFLLLYLGGGVLGGIGWLLLSARGAVPCIGASGAIFAVIGAFAALYPHRQITLLVFYVLPVTLRARTLALIIGGVSLLLLRSNAGGIAHAAHLAGGMAGYLYGMRVGGFHAGTGGGLESLRRMFSGLNAQARRNRFRVYSGDSAEDTPVDWHEVDRILMKVHALGMGSLTKGERDVLDRASRQSR